MAEQHLQDILSNPDAVNSIMGLVNQLTGESAPAPQQAAIPDLSLAGLDPKYIRIAMAVMDAWSDPEDQKRALLAALAPYLSADRAAQVERAMQIARIAKAIRALIDGIKEEGGA